MSYISRSSFFWIFAKHELFQAMIPMVYQYTTGNLGYIIVYMPVGGFDVYGFHDTNL